MKRTPLQLWLVFTWTDPARRRSVVCSACSWRGRRLDPATLPCPRCGGTVRTRS